MSTTLRSDFDPRFNVTVLVYERTPAGPRLIGQRETHNVMTNTGRSWLVQRLGAASYTGSPPTPNTTEVIKYVGFGVGGALQTTAGYMNTQAELASVVALEDPVPFKKVGDVQTYLETVNAQEVNNLYFPGVGRTVFVYDVPEAYISFAGNESFSALPVGTEVAVSEAGLYLSNACPTYDVVNGPGPSSVPPTSANRLACYNIFDPIVVTQNVMLRILWEIRV